MNRIIRFKQQLKDRYGITAVQHSSLFDEAWYRAKVLVRRFPNVKAQRHITWTTAGGGLTHRRGLTRLLYLRDNPDVAEAGICVALRWHDHGRSASGLCLLKLHGDDYCVPAVALK